MIASILIISVSLIVFAYWFRHTCVLILSAEDPVDYATPIARANHLSFLQARHVLLAGNEPYPSAVSKALDDLHESLDRDYQLLSYLWSHVASCRAAGRSFEKHLLALDYQLMRIGYCLARRVSAELARMALVEMTSIVQHMAGAMGKQVATFSKT